MGSNEPGGYSTMIIKASLPGLSGRSFDMSDVTFACGAFADAALAGCAIAVPVMRDSRANATSMVVIVASVVRIRLLPVRGGAIRRDRCGRGALRPAARASAPRHGCPSIGPRAHAR